jgi:hypothetical protein
LIYINPASATPTYDPGTIGRREGAMQDPAKLRELASWYREYAERTGNPTIWECRLRTAEKLDVEAARIERLIARSDAASAFSVGNQ